MTRPVIAWLTDFGIRDHYVGTMKGVALSIAPDVTLVDITHDIGPQDVRAGAWQLALAQPYFPAGTIFVAVVDPGVGSHRRAVAVQTERGYFVGPDNGLLWPAIEQCGAHRAVELTTPQFALPAVSRTFEGRDRFAPAAAWIARGVALGELGPNAEGLVRVSIPAPLDSAAALTGEVLAIDRFGNAITNISRRGLESWSGGAEVMIEAGSVRISGIVESYGVLPPGAPCALIGSAGWLEIAVTNGSAAHSFGLAGGSPVTVTVTGRGDL